MRSEAEEEAELEAELASLTPDQLLASICEDSFYDFLLELWETVEAVEFVPNWHIEYLAAELQDVYERWARGESQPDMLINVPPGTSKSTTVSQLFAAWLWVKNAGIRIIGSSHSAPLAIKNAIKARLCLRSKKFNRLWPGLIAFQGDQDGKTDYANTRLGQRLTTSTGTGGAMGNHADFILIDDPINPLGGASEAGRLQAAAHLETLSTRKTDKMRTVTILLMQRLHEEDPAGIWLKSGVPLRHICLPGELTRNAEGVLGAQVRPAALRERYTDNLLDPRRLGRPALDKLKGALGSYGYAGQVQQIPAPEEGGLIKKAWFTTITWEKFQETVAGAKTAVWLFDADTAYTEKQKNDATALLASCYLGQTLYVRWVAEMRLELPQLKLKLLELVKAHGYRAPYSKLYIEPKASGKDVIAELRHISQLNVVEAPTPDKDKTTRVNAAAPFLESCRVVLIDGSWNAAFISQCSSFPNAAHDDMLDCLTQAIARHNQPARTGTVFGGM